MAYQITKTSEDKNKTVPTVNSLEPQPQLKPVTIIESKHISMAVMPVLSSKMPLYSRRKGCNSLINFP